MSTFTEFAGVASGQHASIFSTAADAVASAGRALMGCWRQAGEIKHLESLSDNQLRDIGITRSEIALVVRGADIDQVRGRHVLD